MTLIFFAICVIFSVAILAVLLIKAGTAEIEHMDKQWAYRRVCLNCKIMDWRKCLDGSQFWAGICGNCGKKETVLLCRLNNNNIETY